MLFRKFSSHIEAFLKEEPNKILLVNGARQIGKSYLIRYIGKKMFRNFIEINLKEDKEGKMIFADVRSTEDFYLQLGAIAGKRLGNSSDTIVFLDEIQAYPQLMTMLKFLNLEGRYRYIASGSELGIALSHTPSIPMGSIAIEQMYPLDFEEFLMASGCGKETLEAMRDCYIGRQPLSDSLHRYMMNQFKIYLLTGGMPDAINKFLETRNIALVRKIQNDIHEMYKLDASQYGSDKKLAIRKIYDLIPSNMENKRKRIVVKKIEDTAGHKQFSDYADEFEYLTNSGVALAVKAISNPKFPLKESESKNLIKLYLNDVGLLTAILYKNNINAVLGDERSINLGSVYESVVAQELCAHGCELHYYDNKQRGEVDFIIDDYDSLSVLPIEVKSGKDYKVHSALDNFINTPDYNIKNAVVLYSGQKVYQENGITYLPIYYVMFMCNESASAEDTLIPEFRVPDAH